LCVGVMRIFSVSGILGWRCGSGSDSTQGCRHARNGQKLAEHGVSSSKF
jgi:hypothetical protein